MPVADSGWQRQTVSKCQAVRHLSRLSSLLLLITGTRHVEYVTNIQGIFIYPVSLHLYCGGSHFDFCSHNGQIKWYRNRGILTLKKSPNLILNIVKFSEWRCCLTRLENLTRHGRCHGFYTEMIWNRRQSPVGSRTSLPDPRGAGLHRLFNFHTFGQSDRANETRSSP